MQWFDPDRDSLYPDRIRRRPPGADSAGLGTHLDPGTLDLWMTEAYQQAFRHLFDGSVEQYDPWDAAHRTAGPQYPGSTMCSAFRTFQGWTALSDMDHDQGVLHTVPIPEAMAYLLLRPLLADVPDDDMCGVTVNQVFPANEQWHPLLMEALSRHPRRQGRRLRLVALRHDPQRRAGQDQQGWGNVMYIPAAPWCPRNEAYAANVREAFLTGSSPSDFPEEHYEREWPTASRRRPQRHRAPRARARLTGCREERRRAGGERDGLPREVHGARTNIGCSREWATTSRRRSRAAVSRCRAPRSRRWSRRARLRPGRRWHPHRRGCRQARRRSCRL